MAVDLAYKSGEVVIYPEMYTADQLSFNTSGTAKEIDISIFDDQNRFRVLEEMTYLLTSGDEIIDKQVASEGRIDFRSLAVGRYYAVKPAISKAGNF
jgi:hypothetical protein